eukprot:Gregarina_sp_Poly_1__128@NODE_102_length_14381_cov_59_883820_g89_i0_p4_GENE_NODE_102_length_14381_cov_59_883820_g89_i0NODE_102_length_14381_cov_59_883820_g89_i0_p4_ORF_typecomplete_len414_score79_49RecQ_Zn_bind/PF16124_5/2_9e12RQC/PF09382_10/4_6e06HRDC/PF00570_23/9_5e05_NODE_102_length_14381_cov_59_883820_g89_i027033944
MKDKGRHQWLNNTQHKVSTANDKTEAQLRGGRGLLEMVEFCQNQTKCRRELLLQHFGEIFQGECSLRCDNCERRISSSFKTIDISGQIPKIIALVSALQPTGSKTYGSATLLDIKAILMGTKFKKLELLQTKIDQSGCWGILKDKGIPPDDCVRLLTKMLALRVLRERTVPLQQGGVAGYMCVGDRAYMANKLLQFVEVETKKRKTPRLSSILEKSASPSVHDDVILMSDEPFSSRNPAEPKPAALEKAVTSRDIGGIKPVTSIDTAGLKTSKEKSQKVSETTALTTEQREVLYKELLALRQNLVTQYQLRDASSVINLDGLRRLAKETPTSLAELRKMEIHHFSSKAKTDKYGFGFVHHISLFLKKINAGGQDDFVQVGGSDHQSVCRHLNRLDSFVSAASQIDAFTDLNDA